MDAALVACPCSFLLVELQANKVDKTRTCRLRHIQRNFSTPFPQHHSAHLQYFFLDFETKELHSTEYLSLLSPRPRRIRRLMIDQMPDPAQGSQCHAVCASLFSFETREWDGDGPALV